MRQLSYSKALNEALRSEMRRDSSVFVAGEDVALDDGAFRVTAGLLGEFGPDRAVDCPISEAAIVGLGVGAAAAGLRPVVEIMFMDFVGCCLDQIFNQAAKMRYMFGGNITVPLVIRTPCGAGFSIAAQHSQSVEAWFAHVPGLKVVMPATPYDAKGLLISAIRDDNPVVFVEHKRLYRLRGDVPEEAYAIPLGKADVKREGRDVTLIATSMMVHEALAAADMLAETGISAEVVDLRTLVPLDLDTIIGSVAKTHRAVVVHEAVKFGGFGGEVAASIMEEAFDYLDAPVKRVGAPFSPVPMAPVLEKAYLPDRNKIVAAARETVPVRVK
ncbi:MAG: alpha-ketoacid dehydrogenase subunit beta [Chloroflexi bacterium]|nr:alpha-ketoacid dehydrogenase subunit beta [Chloroflexota bacterium]